MQGHREAAAQAPPGVTLWAVKPLSECSRGMQGWGVGGKAANQQLDEGNPLVAQFGEHSFSLFPPWLRGESPG